MRPAIILSGHTMGLAVTRALGSRGVPIVLIHHDDRDMAQVSRYVTTAIRAPHPEKETEAFIGCLRDCAPRFRGGIIFPTSDEALVIAAKYKCLLEKDFIVACPEWEVTRRCIDNRITSYNVCYTKLLRPAQISNPRNNPRCAKIMPNSKSGTPKNSVVISCPWLSARWSGSTKST